MGGLRNDHRVPEELLAALRCARCGGRIAEQPSRRAKNPFLSKEAPRGVCVDCGLDFEVEISNAAPSSRWPWT